MKFDVFGGRPNNEFLWGTYLKRAKYFRYGITQERNKTTET